MSKIISKITERIYAHREIKSPQRKNGFITRCCVCRRYKIRGSWMYYPSSHGLEVSHSFCPKCKDKQMEEIKCLTK